MNNELLTFEEALEYAVELTNWLIEAVKEHDEYVYILGEGFDKELTGSIHIDYGIILWEDGTKTVVKARKGIESNPYYGFTHMAVKKLRGYKSRVSNFLEHADGNLVGGISMNNELLTFEEALGDAVATINWLIETVKEYDGHVYILGKGLDRELTEPICIEYGIKVKPKAKGEPNEVD